MRFLIRWNTGYGDNYEVVEAATEEAANEMAYAAWKEDAEANADYSVEDTPEEDWEDYL